MDFAQPNFPHPSESAFRSAAVILSSERPVFGPRARAPPLATSRLPLQRATAIARQACPIQEPSTRPDSLRMTVVVLTPPSPPPAPPAFSEPDCVLAADGLRDRHGHHHVVVRARRGSAFAMRCRGQRSGTPVAADDWRTGRASCPPIRRKFASARSRDMSVVSQPGRSVRAVHVADSRCAHEAQS